MKTDHKAEVWYCPEHDSLVLARHEPSKFSKMVGFRITYKNYSFWKPEWKCRGRYYYVGPFEPSFEIPSGETFEWKHDVSAPEIVTPKLSVSMDLPKVKLSTDTYAYALSKASAPENGDTVDGITLVTGDRVLVKATPLIPKYDGKVEYSPNKDSFWNGFTRGANEASDAQAKASFKLNVVYDPPVIPKLKYRPYGYFEKLYNDLKSATSKTDAVTRDLLFLSLMVVLGIATLAALALVSHG